MRKENEFLSEEIEIPEIVMQKADTAFNKIKAEDKVIIMRQKNNKKTGKYKTHAAAIAGVCILAIGSVSAVAAIHHNWARGMKGTVQASDEQQQTLTDQGVAAVLSENENYEEMAVTSGDVTVVPEMVIADDRFAFASFSVKGYGFEEGQEPGFDMVNADIRALGTGETIPANMWASFYSGVVCGEDGNAEYEDGSPLAFDDAGRVIYRYQNSEGDLEYVIMVSVADQEQSILGQTLHVELNNLGTLYKTEYTGAVEGEWNFDIPLPDVSAAAEIQVEKEVPGTVFTVKSVEISPISIKMNYSVDGEVKTTNEENGVPAFCGVVLKNGKRLPYLSNGGSIGYTDDTMTAAYEISAFDRVIETDQIEALLLRTESGADCVEVPINIE